MAEECVSDLFGIFDFTTGDLLALQTNNPAAPRINIQGLISSTANSVVLLGDSRMSANTYNSPVIARYDYAGWFVALNQYLGAPFDIRANFGTGGVDSSVVRYVQLPQALALNPRPALAVLDVGYNNFVTDGKAEQVIADVTAIAASLYAAGIRVIIANSIPGDTVGVSGSKYANQCAYNRWLLNTGAQLPGVVGVLDLHSLVMDPTTGVLRASYKDAVGYHLNASGSGVAGIGAAPTVNRLAKPTTAPFLGAFDATAQLMGNPRLVGSTATGIGAGTTGTLPNNHTSGRSGTAAGAFSQVARPDTLTGTRTRIAHTGGARGDTVTLGAANFNLVSYAASTFYNYPDRIRPTVPNGRQYLVTNTGGYTDAGTDPTASWPTTLGATFTVNGNLNIKVVDSIDVGDKIQLVTEVWADSFSGGAAIYNSVFTLNASYSPLFTANGGFVDNQSTAYPASVAPYQIIRSAPMVILPTTKIISVTTVCATEAGVTGNWYVGRCELQKYA